MQRAARKVAQENNRLRTLLAHHGVLKDEVDSFLRSCEQTEGSSTPEIHIARSPGVLSSYMTNSGPRALYMQPLSQTHTKEHSPHPPPVNISRQAVNIPKQPGEEGCSATMCKPQIPIIKEDHTDAAIVPRPVEVNRHFESYYASPSETESSSPPMPQESRSAFAYSDFQPSVQSQGCCPPPKARPEVVMEDPDCPSTADCFCPPRVIANGATTTRKSISSDEISCETAATIIAQMRGDRDELAARASIGCSPGEVCSIKNSFLMQILDE